MRTGACGSPEPLTPSANLVGIGARYRGLGLSICCNRDCLAAYKYFALCNLSPRALTAVARRRLASLRTLRIRTRRRIVCQSGPPRTQSCITRLVWLRKHRDERLHQVGGQRHPSTPLGVIGAKGTVAMSVCPHPNRHRDPVRRAGRTDSPRHSLAAR